ncbi:hypothetical protein AC578_10770 [Pseudocercospora eumusae]|uniref:Zn(2)-C6 fungal-type domain-containing protein n=1 Tax=Pseudocercospora eumusae TaxID=321146 RepID=A0A139GZT6_9PEZI|nr:hypothetical protein AC578_10770 [Pseudocercospora eumusae]
MPSRRHHSKTTTGCTSCKMRHVKCDETRPICKSCIRRRTECVYTTDKVISHKLSPASESPSNGVKPPTATADADSFDWLDLELMHRWTIDTSQSLFPAPSAQKFWQKDVPVLAQTHHILRHAILAVAASDLACNALSASSGGSSPDPNATAVAAKYRTRGLHHQQAILPLFQDLLQNQNTTEEKNIAFLVSIFLVILAFSSVQATDLRPTLSDLMDVFALFRGPKALWDVNRDRGNELLMETLFPGSRGTFREVFARTDISDPPWPELGSLPLDEVCTDVVLKLKQSFWASQHQPGDVRALGYFPALVPEEFCTQARERRPHAILILEHYAEVLKMYRERWWVGPWHSVLLAALEIR